MTDQERIKQWLLETVRLIVDCPDDVTVEAPALATDGSIDLLVSVHPSDAGRLIGKQGRMAHSLRIIGGAMAMARGTHLALDIVERVLA